MGRIGHEAIRELVYTPTVGSAAGVEVMELAGLYERARRHGNDPHAAQRPTFHQLIGARDRPLHVWVDFVEHELRPGSWLWIRPGQVQRFGADLDAADGVIVLFQPGFLAPATVAAAHMDPPYEQRPLTPEGPAQEGVRRALDHLAYEYGAMASLPLAVHADVLRALLSVLVVRLAQARGAAPDPSAASETFRRFHAVVERDHAVTRRVEDYAAALGYSPRTLTRASLAATGRTAKQYVDDRVLLEAKRLLQHSGLAAKEVADELGFADASDFTKFFRLRTGRTPGAFRSGGGVR
ncbi:helix-turn-helix transcriptional regulator [Streptomyces sp. VRA16 Mangrove soil]|uniref:helix-turn-helix transcriptional regulator n=1 Tax=Streptomyces sp. VRA16 Mangrove soil TaxID=2817434 RepID=UPI001AA00A22|nr:helix-turn-helix transcriptional regulator [Streptomyces sp. VRA16 Mangrove soil]MBO1330174.1 helix-turn-helix transcriptional regulator [Streptomyces sp. VRA16 Mangrove soil]